jgi:hypothetical protein
MEAVCSPDTLVSIYKTIAKKFTVFTGRSLGLAGRLSLYADVFKSWNTMESVDS